MYKGNKEMNEDKQVDYPALDNCEGCNKKVDNKVWYSDKLDLYLCDSCYLETLDRGIV